MVGVVGAPTENVTNIESVDASLILKRKASKCSHVSDDISRFILERDMDINGMRFVLIFIQKADTLKVFTRFGRHSSIYPRA